MGIAIFRQEDYRAAGLQVFPVALGVPRTKRAIAVYSVVLVAVTLAPVVFGIAGSIYASVVGVSGLAFIAWALRGFRAKDTVAWARTLFLASMPHLVVVFVALVASAW
jgi:protoheme IX farnesyltransferase